MNFQDLMPAVWADSLDGIVIADAATTILDCNPAYAQLCGYHHDELVGQKTNIIRSGLTPRRVFDDMWAQLSTTGRWVGELINKRKDGSLWISFLSITRVLDDSGAVRAYVGMARDLTERRQLEDQLQQQLAATRVAERRTATVASRLKALLESVTAAVAMFDVGGTLAEANHQLAGLLGVGQETVMGQPLEWLKNRLHTVFRDADKLWDLPPGQLTTLTTREVAPRHFECYRAPVNGATGTVWGELFTFRDVTKVIEVDRMKSEFIATVSHELRTPMTSVKGSIGLLLGGATGTVSESQRELLTIAQNNIDRLIRLVNDILDVSRIDAGRLELNRQPIDLTHCIADCLQELDAFRQQRGITVEESFPANLPQVLADADRTRQVLVNLIGNALKFTDPGGRVTIQARHDGRMVQVDITDTGIGIPADQLLSIFERFHRASTNTPRRAGTGLGLSICRAIVKEHGGEIWATSEVGRGSTFSFTLPTVTVEKRQAARQPAAPVRPAPSDAAAAVTVLVCDDEPDVVSVLALSLQQAGFRVLTATSGEEAVRLCHSQRVDCITLDLLMPGLDGVSVLQTLRGDERTRSIPAVVISAYLESHSRALMGMGVAGLLPKPVDPAELLHTIQLAVGRPVAGREPPDVLVVDDDPGLRRVVELVLTEAGYRVRTAADGLAAYRAIEAKVPDLLVLDILMPRMDGFHLVQRLRENPRARQIPLLVLTALDLTAGERTLLRLGPTVHVSKGARLQEQVVVAVQELLGGPTGLP